MSRASINYVDEKILNEARLLAERIGVDVPDANEIKRSGVLAAINEKVVRKYVAEESLEDCMARNAPHSLRKTSDVGFRQRGIDPVDGDPIIL